MLLKYTECCIKHSQRRELYEYDSLIKLYLYIFYLMLQLAGIVSIKFALIVLIIYLNICKIEKILQVSFFTWILHTYLHTTLKIQMLLF